MKQVTDSVSKYVGALVTAALLILSAGEAKACSTPVFRYALERWMPDYYELRITMPTGKEIPAWVTETVEKEEGVRPNAFVRTLESPGAKSPTMSVHFPRAPDEVPAVWQGALTKEALTAVLDSPVRAEIARRLIHGDSAIWLFLESPDKAKNEAAMATLEKELEVLEKELRLPVDPLAMMEQQEGEDPPAPEGVSFSVITLKRDDPNEEFLRSMLLLTEPDLRELSSEPMAFPVYGRGRALYALVGKGIHADVIAEACVFLTGACSCQVKAQNPGVDLLITADWDEVFYGQEIEEEPPPPLTSIMPSPLAEESVAENAPEKLAEAQPIEAPTDLSVETETKSSFLAITLTIVLAGSILLIGGTSWLLRGRAQ